MRPRATYKIFSGAVMTGTNVLVSVIVDTWMFDQMGLEWQWTGNPTAGAPGFSFEASNQYDPINNPNVAFVTFGTAILTPSIVQPAGAPNPGAIYSISATTAVPMRYFRIRYINASGSGILDAWINGMGAG